MKHLIVKDKLKEAGFTVSIVSRKNKTDPSGKKLYFKVNGKGGRTEYNKAYSIIKEHYPNAYSSSGGFCLDTFNVTFAEYMYVDQK